MACVPLEEEEEEEEGLNTEILLPRSQGDAVQIFCGPNVGLVWPWKSHTITEALEVHGYRLRSQYLPPNYKQLQEDLTNNPRIQQALAVQRALLEVRTEAEGGGGCLPSPSTVTRLCPKHLVRP